MKYRLLRFSLLCMLVMLCGGSVWAQDVTATLTGADLLASTSPSTSYADYTASETFTGLQDDQGNAYFGRWTYQKYGQNYLNMVQIKKVESSNTTRIQLPKYSGNIKTITLSVTDANSTAYDTGTGAKTQLAIINSTTYTSAVAKNANNQVLVVGSSSTARKTYEFDFTQLEKSYNGEGLYICSIDATARIWSIVVTYDDGSSDTRAETTLEFGDHQATGSAGGSMDLPSVTVKTVDGATTLTNPEITWASSNTTVATIADGTISFLKGGKTTITASYAGDDTQYKSCSNSFDLTIGGAITDGVFDFNNNQDYGSGATVDASAYITEDKTWTAGNVTLVTSGKYRWYTDGSLRIYAPDEENTTLKLSVPEGYKITAITITGSSINDLTASTGTYSTGTWSGSSQEVTLSRGSSNSQIKTITVTYNSASAPEAPTFSPAGGTYEEAQAVVLSTTTDEATIYYSTDGENFSVYSGAISVTETTTISAYTKKGEEVSATVTATYTINPPITTITDLNAAATQGGSNGASVKYKFTDIYVAYVSGYYNYITDGTNYALLYGSNLGLTAGDQISGSLTGNAKVYNGLPEIVVTASDLSILSQTAGAFTPEASIVTVDQLSDNVNKFIKIENATYVSASGSNLTFKVGETDFTVRNQFSYDVSGLEANKAYNITGFGSVYNTTYQIYPTEITEATPAITVAKPVISGGFPTFYTEKTVAITCGTEGATIYYTTDGSVPTAESTLYTEPFTINASCTIKAIAIMDNVSSEVAEMAFIKYVIHDRYIVVGDENTPLTADENFKMTFNEEEEAYEYTLATTAATTSFRITTKIENSTLTPISINDEKYDGTVELEEEYDLGANETYPTINIAGSGIYLISVYDPGSIIITKTGDLSPFYILGDPTGWGLPTNMTEMPWNVETQAYEYTFTTTGTSNFCFSETNEINENDWTTFNSNYRYGNGIGNFAADEYINSENSITLSKIGGDGNIQLNTAGTWTISVTADKVLTITGTPADTPAEDIYVVAGGYSDQNKGDENPLFGTAWGETLEANQMTLSEGVYTKTYNDVELTEGTINYQIVKNGSSWIPGSNKWFDIKAGKYDITFTYDPNATEGDGITMTAILKIEDVFVAGNGDETWLNNVSWDPACDDNQMTEVADGLWEITFENVAEGIGRQIKFALNGDWTHNFGGTFTEFGESTDAVYNSDNITFDTEEALQNITIQLDLREFNYTTKEGAKFTITSEPVEVPVVGFRDIKVTLNDADMWQNKINSSGAASTVYITVDAEGNIDTTENADEAAATLKGYWHGAQYGWQKFSAVVPVEGCVKITLGASNYGTGAVIVTNSDGDQVAKIDNHTGAMWSTSNPDNVAVGYYRTNEPTTLTFSECDYIPYFAVEAIDEADLPAEVTNYNVTFAAGEGVEGVAPAAVEVEAGNKITAPANYTLYKDGSTLTGWSDGETTYAPGDEITPAADMQLTAVFTENAVSLADRTETVSISWALGQKSGDEGVEYNGNKGVVVTRAAVNNKRIDAKLDVDATNGKFYNKRDDELAMINANTKLTVPACKGAIVTVKAYATGYNLTIDGTAMTDNGDKTYTYTVADEKESIDIIPAAQVYLSFVNVTLPVVDGSNLLYTWESPIGNPVETGGTIAYVNGDGNRLNYQNSGYYTICLNGKKANINDATASANAGKMVITLDNALHAGDKINMTAYITNSASKTASAYVLFETGTSIDGEDYSDAANIGLATPGSPTTTTITVPEAAAGSKTITLTRSKTGTNLFITKLVITTTVEDDPDAIATPVITPKTGTYASEQEVTITCETEDANIYYTLDGTDPTAESTEYTAAFTVTETTTVRAIAIKGENSSEIAESVITIVNVQPGESNLIWDYTEKNIPTKGPDNGLYYNAYVNDAAGTNNGMHGVKLNSTSYAYFAKNPVEGKLTLTFGRRSGSEAYAVNVYACTITDGEATKGDLIGEISVDASPGTGSIDIAADVTGIYIERSTSAEGVLQKIVFKEKVARTFVDFEITNDELKGTYDPSKLPTGVDFSGTPHNDSHGYQNVTLTVPTDGGAVKFTIGGCQYANPATFDVKNSNSDVVATIDEKTSNCYHLTDKDISTRTVTYIYTGEATTLTFGPMAYLPYFKAEAVEVQEVTVTYKDQNGTILGEKKVIEGDAIGESPYSEADLTIPEGEKFRGWTYTSGVKVKATDVVTGNTTVLASVTPIETATVGSIQTYDLTSSIFYPEDHETFNVDGAEWHDSQHGFSVANGSTISVQTAGKAQVVVTLCQHSSEGTVTVKDANGNTVGKGFNAKVATCGTTAVVNYNGEATWLTFTFSATAYIHSIKVYNVTDFVEKDEESGWYILTPGDAAGLVLALNAAASEPNSKIFLPNGTYDLGQATLTTISGQNVSIIGESMDNVIIKTKAPKEGLGTADLFLNTATGLYMQDLTLKNDFAYTGNNGRAAVMHDKGTKTICKNVKMLSYQDTYYSHKVGGLYYFEDGEIHGTVDYLCGDGKVYFNGVKLVNEERSSATVTANSELYVFNNCVIENNADKYNFGRAWSNNPVCIWLNTTLMDPDKLVSDRWLLTGINCDYSVAGEFGTKNSEGTDITPESNNVTFTKENTPMNTILTAEQAATYTIGYVLGEWATTAQAEATQVAAPKGELKDGVITWTPANNGATAYAIFKDGKFLGITTESSWTVEEAAGAPRRADEESQTTGYTIRAANSRGGFGEPAEVNLATAITNINAELNGDVKIYDLQGRQVKTATKGVYIINGKKVVIK